MALQPSTTTGLQRTYTCSIGYGGTSLAGYKDEGVDFICYSCATKIGLDGLPGTTVTDCSGASGKHLVLVHNKNRRSIRKCVASKFDGLSLQERLVKDHNWYKGWAESVGQANLANGPCFEWESSTAVCPHTRASAARIEARNPNPRPALLPRSVEREYQAGTRNTRNPPAYELEYQAGTQDPQEPSAYEREYQDGTQDPTQPSAHSLLASHNSHNADDIEGAFRDLIDSQRYYGD